MKDIKNYEGLYAITSCGRVWSYTSKKFLRPIKQTLGYLTVALSKNGSVRIHLVHRLVAEAYIPNPDNLPEVNHKDECKTNNCIKNLEWCTRQYNSNYGSRTSSFRKKVYCVELDKVFSSVAQATRELGIGHHIVTCCKNPEKTCGGYHWRYAD